MKLFLAAILILAGAIIGNAQVAVGGTYTLDKSVIAAGGGASSDATGALYTVNGTIGQSAAGAISNGGTYVLTSGFQTPGPFTPTAAAVLVSGRVVTAKGGRGIRNVMVTMTDQDGTTRTAITTTFGYFHFTEVPAGATYIFNIRAKRYVFGENTIVRYLNGDTNDLVFTAY